MTYSHIAQFHDKKFFKGLDGLRFLSIFAVVWHHSVPHLDYFKIGSYGFLGVDLFFVISGFLIVTLILREKEQTGDVSLKKFYLRRTLRIFPLYYGFILGLAFLYYFFAPGSEVGQAFLGSLPIYFLYLANIFPVAFGIFWSLASEEQFYLLWPFLEKYLSKKIFLILFIFILLNQLINFFRVPIFEFLGAPQINKLFIVQITFTPILIGVVLAHLLHKKIGLSYLIPLIDKKYSAVLWLSLILVIIEFSPSNISGFPRLSIQLLMVLLVGSVALRDDNYLNVFLTLKPIARVGAISYGVYLFHIHGIMISKKLLQQVSIENHFIVFIVSFILTAFIAELSFRFYEKPFLKLKSKFSSLH